MTIGSNFFRQNRKSLGILVNGGLIVLTAYDLMQRSADMAHEFTQEANFWYLTGVEAAKWRMIYDASRDHCWLVRPKISEVEKIFDGQLSDDHVCARSGVDEIIDYDEFEALLRQLARKHTVAYTVMPAHYGDAFVVNPAAKNLSSQLERIFHDVIDCQPQLTKLRAIKQPEEIAAIKKAARLSIETYEYVKDKISTYRYEYELEADFTAQFRRHNARHAYTPIVAAGMNATTLHYIENNSSISTHNMVLIDIGATVDGYASDITRTYAAGGQPTKRRQAVHDAVVEAQKRIISLLKPGLDVVQYQESVDAIMLEACHSLGLAAESDEATVRTYMPHAVSHGLGIDVHDSLGRPKQLAEGMVLTVEPGIYIPAEKIGVRIEDDILITAKGRQNLTARLSTDW